MEVGSIEYVMNCRLAARHLRAAKGHIVARRSATMACVWSLILLTLNRLFDDTAGQVDVFLRGDSWRW